MPAMQIPSRSGRAAAALLALIVAGCATAPVPPPTQPTVTSAPAGDATIDGPLKAARSYAWTPQMDESFRRLRGALGGGATVAQTTDARLWVSLPTAEAFASGRSALRPVASGWLDQVVLAVRGNRRAEMQIVASADPGSRGPTAEALALDRAASARDWMVARGIPAPRLTVSGVTAKAATAGGERRLEILIGERAESPPAR
jgi:outer membrane protein OmpA-like peptidoglycan-associated protein